VLPHDSSVAEVLNRWRETPPHGVPSLRELCGGDDELFQKVLAVLRQEPTALDPYGPPTATAPPDAHAPTATTGHRGLESTRDDLPRPEVPGYEVLGYLGRGGWGVVFRARDVRLGREVALKLLTPAGVYHPEIRERFTREGRALARLDHPNVIPIHDAGEAGSLPYFAMKYVPGGALSAKIEQFGRDPYRAVRLMTKVARAVQYLHDQGIVHRDLKPANILLGPDDEPFVADFGMVKWVEDDRELTTPGTVLGTRLYMAPEQAAGDNDLTGPSADVWAIGVILYELLAGHRPFDHRDVVELERQIRHESPPPLSSIPPPLAYIVGRCLAKLPSERYPTAGAVADDLDRWLMGEPIPDIRQPPLITRRRLLASLGAMAAVGVGAAILPWRSWLVTKRGVLIGPNGKPVRYEFVPGSRGEAALDESGYFRVSSRSLMLVELIAGRMPERLIFEAEVAALDTGSTGQFGLYVARRGWVGEPPAVHSFIALAVYDAAVAGVLADRAHVGLHAGLYALRDPLGTFGFIGQSPTPIPVGERRAGAKLRWHSLTIEATPDMIRGAWRQDTPDGPRSANVSEVTAESAAALFRGMSRKWDPRPDIDGPPFGTGLGLFVYDGSLFCRNATVRPLELTA
jgi:hypothetical protein